MALHYSTRKMIFKELEQELREHAVGAGGLARSQVLAHYAPNPQVNVTSEGLGLVMQVGFEDRFDLVFEEEGLLVRSPFRLRLRVGDLTQLDRLVDRVLEAQRELAQRHQQRDKVRTLQRRLIESQLRLQFQDLPVPLAVHFPPAGVQLVFHIGPVGQRALSFWLPLEKGQTTLPFSLHGVAELVRAAQALADRPVVFQMPAP